MKKFHLQNVNLIEDEKNCDKNLSFFYSVGKTFGLFVFVFLLITMANVNARGQLADAFNPNPDCTVFALKIQTDGKIVIGGCFTSVGGQARVRVARLNADGTLDTTFIDPVVNDIVYAVAIQSDGKILIGGSFTSVGGQARTRIARLNTDGTLDTSFINTNINAQFSYIRAIVVQPDGKILVGGFFSTIGGQTRNGIARLNADGTLDTVFDPNPGTGSVVRAIVLQPDGKILVGGLFTTIGGAPRIRIARLNVDGTADATFTSPFTAAPNGRGIHAIALQSDGRILAGGSPPSGEPIKALSRLNTDGTLDTAFNQNVDMIDGEINALTVQANGKIIIGGIIFNPIIPFRLNADGKRDVTFNPNPVNGAIFAIEVQPDQKIVVGGIFNNIGGVNRNNIARLLSEPTNLGATKFDFDGDTRADIATFRPSNGVWYIYQSAFVNQSGGRVKSVAFGIASDRLAPADYDGDFKTDIAVFREGSLAYFYILQSETNTFRFEQFGTTGDVPVVGDWDGDRKADVAVYRNGSTAGAQSYFYYRPTTATGVDFRQITWGVASDKPVVGDFDGDGKQDAAVFRPSNGTWYVLRSSDNQLQAAQFGIASDKLVAADYDGDNKTDYAVFRSGIWYLQRSQLGFTSIQFGVETDVPTPADYDGDGKADTAVFRNGIWYLNRSTANIIGVAFGISGDKPIPNAFVQ